MGRPDSGKSTLALALAAAAAGRAGAAAAVLNSDPGQSHLGPPTTVAWGLLAPAEAFADHLPAWSDLTLGGLGFVGSTSPYGHLLEMVSATYWCCNRAAAAAERVILDTSGLASGPLGTLLKTTKIDLLAPDMIVLLERRPGELERLAHWARAREGLAVEVLAAAEAIKARNPQARAEYRRSRWRTYLQGSRRQLLPEGVAGRAELTSSLPGVVVAARDRTGETLGVGLLTDPAAGEILAPWEAGDTATVSLGSILLDEQLGEHRVPRSGGQPSSS